MQLRIALLAVALATALPARGDTSPEQLNVWRDITFTAPIPCSVICPYWVDTLNSDADGDGVDDINFSACGNPGGTGGSLGAAPGVVTPGTTYDDVVVGPMPDGARLLIFRSSPEIDWDTFICSTEGEELASGANMLNNCSGIFHPWPFPTGCPEDAVIQASVGERYILRAYNWSDPLPLQARYCFSSQGACSAAP